MVYRACTLAVDACMVLPKYYLWHPAATPDRESRVDLCQVALNGEGAKGVMNSLQVCA